MSLERLHLDVRAQWSDFRLEVHEELELKGITAIFGPSGSGKSSLLRCICGLDHPERGRISLGGQVWFDHESRSKVPTHRRPVGLLFQDGRLFDHLDVAGNLDFADRRRVPSGAELRPEDVIDAFDLGPLLQRDVGSLSGGERQRVALGRTLLRRPRLLLLDEPLSALDRERKREILPYLEGLFRRFSIPTLYVSHSVEELAWLADEVLVLERGRVRARGPTASILERIDLEPITGRFEACALVSGCIVGHDERWASSTVGVGDLRLILPRIAGASVGETVRLRVRARDVALATRRPEGISIRNVIPGRVTRIETGPSSDLVEVFVDLGPTRIRSRVTRAAKEELGLEDGREVFALIKSVGLDRRLP